MSMSSKTTPFSLELFSFVKKLAGLIEEHLDLGPAMVGQVLDFTYLHKSLPKNPTSGLSVGIVLMTILFNDVTVCKMTSHNLVIQFNS